VILRHLFREHRRRVRARTRSRLRLGRVTSIQERP
jgi:hypothetical protein